MKPARLLFPLVLALPLAAAAEPVRVTTQFTGAMDPSPFILMQLGLGDYYDYRGGPLHFSLSVSTVFDPDDIGLACLEGRCETTSAPIAYTFSFGGRTVAFADDGLASVSGGPGSYSNEISFLTDEYPVVSGNYFMSIDTLLLGTDTSFEADPLALQSVGPAPEIRGLLRLTAMPVDPEVPSYWSMGGFADTASLQVVSAIPEPAGGGMLAAGLAALAALAAGRRRAWFPAPLK